jgi:hypothetical protein
MTTQKRLHNNEGQGVSGGGELSKTMCVFVFLTKKQKISSKKALHNNSFCGIVWIVDSQ